jgi:hypothetical protein
MQKSAFAHQAARLFNKWQSDINGIIAMVATTIAITLRATEGTPSMRPKSGIVTPKPIANPNT